MDIKDRISKLLKYLNINKKDFATSIGVSPGNVSDWLSDKRNSSPSLEALIRISEKFKVDLNWLLTGKGEMFLEKEQNFESSVAEPSSNYVFFKKKDEITKLDISVQEVAALQKKISDLEEEINNLQAQNKLEINELLLENKKLNNELGDRYRQLINMQADLLAKQSK